MWVVLILILIAWVLSPFVLIPLLISMSSKVKKKDAEIRRLNERMAEASGRPYPIRRPEPERPVNSQLTIDDINGLANAGTADTVDTVGSFDIAADGPVNAAKDVLYATVQGEIPAFDPSDEDSSILQAEASAQDPEDDLYESYPQEDVAEEIRKEEKVRRPVRRTGRPRVKRKLETGHILFGIGVVLVFVAGLIFATSMWSIMPSLVKVATLLGAAMFFIVVAWIMESRLKLREASVTMFVLGSAFMSLTVIAIGYFAWFGRAFSLGASSRYLVISISIWVLCATLMLGYKLYGSIVFEMIAYAASCIALALLARHISGRGEVALLVTGIYMFVAVKLGDGSSVKQGDGSSVHFPVRFPVNLRVEEMNRGTVPQFHRGTVPQFHRLLSLGYVALSLLLYLAFGFNVIMSLVMLVCIAIMLLIAVQAEDENGSNPYGFLYYVIPVAGAFFIANTSNVFRFAVPHGDVICTMILVDAAFFVYRYVPVKGKRRLANLSSLITLLICFAISFGKLWVVMDRTHDIRWDILEVLAPLMICAVSVLLFAFEYIRTVKALKKEDTGFYTWSYIISLCIFVFMNLYAFVPITRYLYVWHSHYPGSLIPTGILGITMLVVILIYHYKHVSKSLGWPLIVTERLLSIMLNLTLIISFAYFADLSHRSYASYLLNLPLVAVMVMYQAHIRIKKNNPDGLVSAMLLPFALTSGIDKVMERVFPDVALISENAVFETELIIFLAILAIGFFVYRKVFIYDRGEKRILIDWNILMAGIVLLTALVTGDSYIIDHLEFKACIAFAVFVLYKALRFDGLFRRIAFAFVAAFLCGAYSVQDFIKWNADFDTELICLSLPVFAAVLKYVIFRNRERVVSYISFGIMSLFFLIEWVNIDMIASEPAMPVLNVKLTIFMFVTLGAFAYGLWRRSLGNDLLSLALTVLFVASCIDNRRGGHLIIAAILCIGLIIYFYRKGRQPLCVIPITTLLAIVGDTLNTRVAQFFSTGSFDISDGILVEAKLNHTPQCVIRMIVFAVMLALGRFLHAKVICRADEEHPFRIDWFTIMSLVPVLAILNVGNGKFKWSVSLLMALYLFGYYRRVRDSFNKPILTAISVCMAIAWWTQPIVRVRELFTTEYRILGFIALVFAITKVIYKKELEGGLDLMYYASVASVIWQSVSAIRSAELFDVIILGVVLLAIIIVAFEKKSRQWFLLSAISLVCLFLYMSRGFWRKIVWPVYVFAVGIILIFFATRNEYRKKHPVPEEDKKKFFEGWGR